MVISKLRATELIRKVWFCNNLFKQRHTSHYGLRAGTHPDFHSMKQIRRLLLTPLRDARLEQGDLELRISSLKNLVCTRLAGSMYS